MNNRNISYLAKRLEGFSGSDIASIASEASFGPLRSLGSSVSAIRAAKASELRPISFEDFEKAIAESTKSTSNELLKRYETWRREQGC